jgi:glycosyltransferase involved in cell wall biosynthesis
VSTEKRLRVLLLAEAANPEWVSVPLVGWSHAHALARLVDAHLVTQVRNREAILRTGLVEGRDFTALDSEAVSRPLWKAANLLRGGSGKGWTMVTAVETISYYAYERLAWKHFGERIRAHEFDLVHRITPLSPTTPSLIARKCARAGVPFVLGPLNGGVPWPRAFDSARRQEREWLSYVRDAYKLLPGFSSTREHAAAILVGSKDTLEQVPARFRAKCRYVPENAIDPARFHVRRTRRAQRPLRCVFVGRFVPYKGADMLLEAAAPLLRAGALKLELIGDGPQRPLLESIVEREQLAGSVTFAGWVEHARVQHHLADSDLFVLPSIREFGGGVVLEALAVGLPAAVVAYGGPAELVTDDTGFLIELGPREAIVARLRALLERVSADPQLIEARVEPALARVAERFTWDAKAREVVGIYREILAR